MRLAPGALEVWHADLDAAAHGDDVLTSEERERATRLLSERDRIRWIRSRSLLRRLLADYLEVEPDSVEIGPGRNGKPEIADAGGLEFNLSHSGGAVLVGFTVDNPIGVDIERVRTVREPLATAERVLGPTVTERLRSVSAADLDREFLREWVRYEAALKCRGGGLGGTVDPAELHVIDLDVGPDAAAVALGRAPETVVIQPA